MSRIVLDPAILCGKPTVRGTRLAVEFLLDRIGEGWSFAELVGQYPGLTEDDILACIAYAGRVLREERVYPVPT